jgi:GT2 family glycosyltransferase
VKIYHPDFLRIAIDSIIHQACPDWKLLIICEQENSVELIRFLNDTLSDPRIAIINNKGRGLAGALNTGMRQVKTEFVAILLGDDLWSIDAIATLNQYITNNPEIDFFYSSRQIIDSKGLALDKVHQSQTSFELADFKYYSPVKHLLCWRKSVGLAVGGLDETLNRIGPDDYDFPWRMAESGASFMAIPECLYYYRQHCECYRLTTHTPWTDHIREVNHILKKHNVNLLLRVVVLLRRLIWRSLGSQSVYITPLDRWWKLTFSYNIKEIWKRKQRKNRNRKTSVSILQK